MVKSTVLRNRQFKHTWWYRKLIGDKPKEEKPTLSLRCSKATLQTFKTLFQIEKDRDPDLTMEEFLKKLLSTYYRRF
jgi:hypothetical protein